MSALRRGRPAAERISIKADDPAVELAALRRLVADLTGEVDYLWSEVQYLRAQLAEARGDPMPGAASRDRGQSEGA